MLMIEALLLSCVRMPQGMMQLLVDFHVNMRNRLYTNETIKMIDGTELAGLQRLESFFETYCRLL
jgi:hypothetical protein